LNLSAAVCGQLGEILFDGGGFGLHGTAWFSDGNCGESIWSTYRVEGVAAKEGMRASKCGIRNAEFGTSS
jgi:hypothetical protein